MNAPVCGHARYSRSVAPIRGAPWPGVPVYKRSPERQAAFEAAVANLWAKDSWENPDTGQRELNADLVLEGGGVKGIGLAGAICVLAEAGYRFPRAAGTSAGAIAAVLVAAVEKAGKDMSVLRDYLASIKYEQFMHTGPIRHEFERLGGRFASVCELMFHSGLYSGDYLNDWLGAVLAECGVRTWAELAISPSDDPGMSLPPERAYRAVVHVTDISRGTLVRLPWDYQDFYGLAPDGQQVVSAVRASMSIPFFFVPVRIQTGPAQTVLADGTVIDWDPGTVTMVDGGVLANFPMNAFDRTDGEAPRWPTIGIKLSAEPTRGSAPARVDNTFEEGYRCLRTVMSEWDRYHVEQAAADRTIFVPNGGITATEFGLSPAQQTELFLNGARAATDFLIKWARLGGVPRSKAGVSP